jgi:hypothetical protein
MDSIEIRARGMIKLKLFFYHKMVSYSLFAVARATIATTKDEEICLAYDDSLASP